MKKLLYSIVLLTVGISAHTQPLTPPRFGPTVLLELFSSEGCEGCPYADEFMQEILRLADSTSSPVYVIDYHVDIWNRSGWVDPFSDSSYSKRQTEYMKRTGQQALFTPMLFVNGKLGLPAAARNEVGTAIYSELSKYGEGQLTLNAALTRTADAINVSYNTNTLQDSLQLVLVLTERLIKNKVTSGENAGKLLTHHNVVRFFKTIDITDPAGYTQLPLPSDPELTKYSLVGFLQNKNTWEVYATDELVFRN
ncbi:MAG: DUF1223 domain-containing protein [Bacteroidota bacterium]